MIFPTAGYCLSVRYHSPIWFLLVVMSPRTRTNSGKTGWPLANHLQCSKPVLWMNYAFTMVHSDAHFNWQIVQFAPYDVQWKNVHNAECTLTNPKTPDIWSSAELDYHRARASSPSALNFPSQQEASHYIVHHNFFYLYYFHNCYYYLNTYFFLVLVLQLGLPPLPPALPNKVQNCPNFTTVTHSSLPGGCKLFDDASPVCFSFNSLSITKTSAYVIGNA